MQPGCLIFLIIFAMPYAIIYGVLRFFGVSKELAEILSLFGVIFLLLVIYATNRTSHPLSAMRQSNESIHQKFDKNKIGNSLY